MYHYTYLIENKINGKKYIGVRSCQNDPSTDFYWSSSKSLKHEINLIGRDNFRKIILDIFATRKEAVSNEIELHQFYDVGNNPDFYNNAKQTSTGFDTTGMPSPVKGVAKTPEQKKKQSKIMKLKSKGKNNAMYGKTHSKKTKKLISEKLKGLVVGERNSQFGRIYSDEEKRVRSENLKGINQGTKWFTNGIIIKRFLPGTEPPGFFLGKKIL